MTGIQIGLYRGSRQVQKFGPLTFGQTVIITGPFDHKCLVPVSSVEKFSNTVRRAISLFIAGFLQAHVRARILNVDTIRHDSNHSGSHGLFQVLAQSCRCSIQCGRNRMSRGLCGRSSRSNARRSSRRRRLCVATPQVGGVNAG
jgi:hypothetical protein